MAFGANGPAPRVQSQDFDLEVNGSPWDRCCTAATEAGGRGSAIPVRAMLMIAKGTPLNFPVFLVGPREPTRWSVARHGPVSPAPQPKGRTVL